MSKIRTRKRILGWLLTIILIAVTLSPVQAATYNEVPIRTQGGYDFSLLISDTRNNWNGLQIGEYCFVEVGQRITPNYTGYAWTNMSYYTVSGSAISICEYMEQMPSVTINNRPIYRTLLPKKPTDLHMAHNAEVKWCVERVNPIDHEVYVGPGYGEAEGHMITESVPNYKIYPSINYYGVNYDLDAGSWINKSDWIETVVEIDHGIWKSTGVQYTEDGSPYEGNVWFAYDGFEVVLPEMADVEKEGYELRGWGTVTGSAIEVTPGSNYILSDSNVENRTEWRQENINIKALWEPKNIGVQEVTSINLNGATLTADYAAYYDITDKGFMYKKSTDSEWIDAPAVEEDGKLTATLTGLDINTYYDVKGYLENQTGRIENDVISFRTHRIQSVGEVTVNNITSNSADFRAPYVSDDELLEKGFKYKKASDADWNTLSAIIGKDEMTASISDLTDNTIYEVKAYIKTVAGETVGKVISFTTLISIPEDSGEDTSGGEDSSANSTQPNTGAPVINNSGNRAVWEAVKEQIKQAQEMIKQSKDKETDKEDTEEEGTEEEKNTITIEMNGSSLVPKDVLDSIRGTDTTLVFDMGDGFTWSVNGKSITENNLKDINFAVKLDTDTVPEELIKGVAGELPSRTISLSYNGKFGFEAVLTIAMDKKNAGIYANLFYYNPETKQLELQGSGRIDENGNVEFKFAHASDYVITTGTESLLEKAMDQIAISAAEGKLYVGGTQKKWMGLTLELPDTLKETVDNGGSELLITYQSSNPKVATVIETGKIVAKTVGKTTITTTITIGGESRSFTTAIEVSKPYIKLTKSISSLKKGETFTFEAMGYGVNMKYIKYTTSKKSIVVINKTTGKATAKSSGTDYVIAKVGKVEIKIKVVVK